MTDITDFDSDGNNDEINNIIEHEGVFNKSTKAKKKESTDDTVVMSKKNFSSLADAHSKSPIDGHFAAKIDFEDVESFERAAKNIIRQITRGTIETLENPITVGNILDLMEVDKFNKSVGEKDYLAIDHVTAQLMLKNAGSLKLDDKAKDLDIQGQTVTAATQTKVAKSAPVVAQTPVKKEDANVDNNVKAQPVVKKSQPVKAKKAVTKPIPKDEIDISNTEVVQSTSSEKIKVNVAKYTTQVKAPEAMVVGLITAADQMDLFPDHPAPVKPARKTATRSIKNKK
jgi:hypothetical protein